MQNYPGIMLLRGSGEYLFLRKSSQFALKERYERYTYRIYIWKKYWAKLNGTSFSYWSYKIGIILNPPRNLVDCSSKGIRKIHPKLIWKSLFQFRARTVGTQGLVHFCYKPRKNMYAKYLSSSYCVVI